MWAAMSGQTLKVTALLEADADENAEFWNNYTALMYAASNGYPETVRVLVDTWVSMNEGASCGKWALSINRPQLYHGNLVNEISHFS